MDRETVLCKIQDLFRDVFDDETLVLSEHTGAQDIEGWDSLMQITILESVQNELGVSFTLEEILDMDSVGSIVDAVVRKMA